MIKERINKANNKLNLLAALKQLRADLEKLGPVPNNVEYKEVYNPYCVGECKMPIPKDLSLYDYAVKFFNIVAKFQDTGLLQSGLLADAKSVDELMEHVKNSGRDTYGWVRSKPGEAVTDNNVFLGNIFGLWTNTIAKFKSFAAEKDNTSDWTQSVIQIYQLQRFLNSHVEPMKKLIDSILVRQENAKTGVIDGMFDKFVIYKQKQR